MNAKLRPDWWTKTLVGAVLGLTLALGLSGVFAWLGPGGIHAPVKVQFNMWLIAPVWMLSFSLVYLIRTGWLALSYFLMANVLAYVALFWAAGWGTS
jgi:hypothetical protein